METISLPTGFTKLENSPKFVVLGKQNQIFTAGKNITEAVKFRLEGITNGPVSGFWGTLGRADGISPDWEGDLYCSGEGNESSSGALSAIIDGIREWQPENPIIKSQKIIERFIAFDEVDFGSSEKSRQLRLTLMLSPNQGVILFYHHGTPGSKTQDGEIEYILPIEGNALSDKPGRKTFFFEVPPFSAEHNDLDADDIAGSSRFLVKALVFAIDNESPLEKLRKFEQYGLSRYNPAGVKGFDDIDASQVDLTKKTLLLVHGTFASVRASFSGLTERTVSGLPWLQYMIANGHYEQIIGFDHSTVLDDTFTNVSVFKEKLATAHDDWRFEHTIDIISTSRGGLVVKTMCNDIELNSTNGRMRVNKVALVSCANGAALLDPSTGVPGIRLLLSLLARIPLAPVKVIFTVLQLAFEVYRKQPGTLAQTPGTDRLQRVLSGRPDLADTRYFPVCGNWEPDGFGGRILDAILDRMLHDANDGVNYTGRMNIIPEGTGAYAHPPAFFIQPERLANAFHTRFFTTDNETRPENYIREYLTDDSLNWKGGVGNTDLNV